jgi:recombination protein RecA
MATPDIKHSTGVKELDAVLKSLTKDFGTDLSGDDYGDIVVASTGSLVIDIWTRRGGLPTGRIIEVFGGHKTMKTTFCLLALAARQRWRKSQGIVDKRDLIVDLEHSLERAWMVSLGIDMDQVIWQRVETAEQALEMCRRVASTGHIDYVIFDSVDAAQNEKQIRRKVGETDVGGISKEMNFAMRDLAKIAPRTGTTFLFINQIKMNPGVMYGSPEVTPGGQALSYYASFRIKFLPRQECSDIPGATLMRLRGAKTKMASDVDWEDLSVAVIPGIGYDESYEISFLAGEWDMLRHSGGQTKVRWQRGGEEVPIHPDVDKGKEAGLTIIREYEPVRARLKHAVLRAGGVAAALTDEQVLAMYPGAFEPGSYKPKPEQST